MPERVSRYAAHIQAWSSPEWRRLWKPEEVRSLDHVPFVVSELPPTLRGDDSAQVGHLVLAEYRRLQHEMERVLACVSAKGHVPLLMKGPTLQRFYPRGIFRRFHDLDIAVDSEEQLWSIASALKEAGYEIEGGAIAKPGWGSGTRWFGFFKFLPRKAEWPKVELHLGGFIISHQTAIPYSTLLSCSEKGNVFGRPALVPTDVGALVLFAAEQYGRRVIRPRDYLDFYLLASRASWQTDTVGRLLNHLNLESSFRRLVAELALRIGVDALPQGLVPWHGRFTRPSRRWTLTRNIHHVLPFLRRRVGLTRGLVRTCFNLVDEWKDDLLKHNRHLWLVRLLTLAASPSRHFAAHRLVVLIPIGRIRGPVLWSRQGSRHLLRTPIGSFLLTVHLLDTDGDLEEARQACECAFGRGHDR